MKKVDIHSLASSGCFEGVPRSLRMRVCGGSLWLAAALGSACGDVEATPADAEGDVVASQAARLRAVIGPDGGKLEGETGSAFEGVSLVIPPGTLAEDTEIEVVPVEEAEKPLPEAALPCGPMFELRPLGLTFDQPVEVTLPYDVDIVEGAMRTDHDVKVWVSQEDGWGRETQFDGSPGRVAFELGELSTVAAGINPPKPEDIVHLDFHALDAFIPCLAQYPSDAQRRPEVEAYVVRGDDNDTMFVYGRNLKPNLAFDLFTVERSLLGADGQRDPNFKGFGLAWYQTDMEVNHWGRMRTVFRTVLLDEIFGFDPDAQLAPTQTFHVGFWFNDPNDAAACGFNPEKPTPFNGEQNAGPLAMITLPDDQTGFGPLCTEVDDSVSPAVCKK